MVGKNLIKFKLELKYFVMLFQLKSGYLKYYHVAISDVNKA